MNTTFPLLQQSAVLIHNNRCTSYLVLHHYLLLLIKNYPEFGKIKKINKLLHILFYFH